MFRRVRLILEMIRFSHTLFALPFALLAAVIAWTYDVDGGEPARWRWQDLAGIILCMAFARSAAMAFNRLADRHLDALNPRTQGRHIPAGLLGTGAVAVFAVTCVVGFVAATLLFLPNRWPLYLSVPVLAYLFAYSYTKRFTSLSHFWLGGALMLAPCAAWIALRGSLDWPPVILGAAVMFWVAGFDIIYACQDVDFDKRIGLISIPARLGVSAALRLAAVCHMCMVGILACLPWVVPQLGWVYWVGMGSVACLLAWEHWLVRPGDLGRVNVAFFHVNSIISVGLFLVGTLDLLV